VIDRNSILSVYGTVQLATSQEFYFDSDSVGVRATFRFGACIAKSGSRGEADRCVTRQLAQDLRPGFFDASGPGAAGVWAGSVRSFRPGTT
jgi:hypothetical protein